MSYTKLFSDIVTSSVWSEDDQTRILWITLLALANKHGEVMAAVPGLSKVAAISLEATERALGRLMGPDPYSRTPDDEGRRLMKIDGGWIIVNYEKHRERDSVSDVRSKNAERQRRFRERHKQKTVTQTVTSNASVTVNPYNAEAEAEAEVQVHLICDEKVASTKPGNPVSPKRQKVDVSTDELFLAELKRHYPDVDVDREFRKMRAWQLTPRGKGKLLTRQRIINWLNRCEPAEVRTGGNSHSGEWRDESKDEPIGVWNDLGLSYKDWLEKPENERKAILAQRKAR